MYCHQAMLRGGRCSLEMGDFTKSRQFYKAAVELEPANSQARADLDRILEIQQLDEQAKAAMSKGEPRTALFYLDRALKKCEQSSVLRLRRAEALLQVGRLTDALDASSAVLREDTNNAEATFVRGLVLYRQGNADSAKVHFQQALRLDPDYTRAREQLKKLKLIDQKKAAGNDAFKRGSLDEAHTLYSEALLVDPDNRDVVAKLYCNRATVCSKLGRLEDCIADCTRALEIDPNYEKAKLRRAKTHMDAKQFDEAVRDYETLSSNDPHNRGLKKLSFHHAFTDHMMSQKKLSLFHCSKDNFDVLFPP